MKKGFLFITCEEAKHICDKSQYNEATSWEKFELKLRLLWCHVTKAYVNKNLKLTDAISKSHLNCMNAQERAALKLSIEQHLKNQQ